MTYPYRNDDFANSLALPALVLVDMRREHLIGACGTARADVAGILVRCRMALAHARKRNLPVMFVRNRQNSLCSEAEREGRAWIKGFEPGRLDSVFERVGPSCYGSPYFDEVVEAAGRKIVLAGFLGRGGSFSTAADALSAGHAVTFLKDGISDSLAAQVRDASFGQAIAAFAKFDMRVVTAQSWISETSAALAT